MATPATTKLDSLKDGTRQKVTSSLTSASFSSISDPQGSSTRPPQHDSLCSTYHIYHKKENHARISPSVDSSYERFWGPCMKEVKAKRKAKKLATQQRSDSNEWQVTSTSTSVPDDEGAFFLHTPYLAFHDPPRVLYVGSTKRAVPAVLIHSTAFWRTWKLQLGPSIAKPGVLDPRGVVCWRHHGGDAKAREADGKLLKGYKVRTWRLWCETGKDYVHKVKANRKAGLGPDPDVLEDEVPSNGKSLEEMADVPEKHLAFSEELSGDRDYPVSAEEAVYLKWTSPFSRNTRRYHFQFRGIDFYWKGTGTVKETRTCGLLLHFNHLKLVAQVPAPDHGKGALAFRPELCLGKYTCSIATKKSGKLDLFDGAIWRLVSEYMPELLAQVHGEGIPEKSGAGGKISPAQVTLVKKTLLYQLIVATAMCMVIGERQKRDTIKKIIEAAATEGAGGASG